MFSSNQIINKEYKKSVTKLIIGAILCALALLLLVVGVARFEKLKKNAIHLNDAIISETDRTGRIAYADIEGYMQFASYGDDLGYYIAWDEDLFYILSIKEKDYDYYAEKFNDDAVFYRFWGYTQELPAEARPYAISAFNEEMGEAYVNYDNFDDIFGDVYLSVDKESKVKGLGGFFETSAGYAVGTAFAGIIGLALLLAGLQDRKSFECLKDSSGFDNNTILSQIDSEGTKWYDKLNVYLTDDYLVSVKNGISAVRYSDIFWAYVTRHSTNGISDYNYLNIMTKDGKKIMCGNGKTFGKKHQEETSQDHDEILNILHEKNESIRLGYDQTNLEAFNELKKNLK